MVLSIHTSQLPGQPGSQSSSLLGGAPESDQVSGQNRLATANAASGQVPHWQPGFDLHQALHGAYLQARSYMNTMLARDDLAVDIHPADKQQEVWQAGAVGVFTDQANGRVVKTSSGEEILRLYAHNVQARGIVVDGAL